MTRFSDQFLDELKDRVRVSDVVGKRVQLKRQGRELAGLSPFSKERSPSFFVNDDKGFYHCFSSGEHGDVLDFLQKVERMSFVEAVEHLAGVAGLALPKLDPRAAAEGDRRKGLADWLEVAASWFETRLRGHDGAAARVELERRGLPPEVWAQFRLGYAPADRAGLKDALVQRGARPGDLVAAGLLVDPEDGGAPFDRFRDRIIFPIADARGRIVSFGGRAMNAASKAKYLNGPETPVFKKGRVLYGLPAARALLTRGGPLVAVEGYFDVIACQRAGVPAVAAMGTALTEEQMAGLWRLHEEPTLCFDGDAAGRLAAGRAMEAALPLIGPGRTFRFSIVRGGKDPDDVYREQGAQALRDGLAASTPFARALFERERDAVPLDTPERRAGLKARLRARAYAIRDRDLAHAYREALFNWLDELRPRRGEPVKPVGASAEAMAAAVALRAAGEDVVARLLDLPPEEVDGHADRLFELHSRLGDVEGRMADLRAVLGDAAQMAEFKALKGERDGLRREIRGAA